MNPDQNPHTLGTGSALLVYPASVNIIDYWTMTLTEDRKGQAS